MMRFFSVLALLAIALRAVTPAGFMFGVDETTGMMRIEICHGGMNAAVSDYWLNAETGEVIEGGAPPSQDDRSKDPCPFASLTMIDMPETAPAITPLLASYHLGAKPVAREVLAKKPRFVTPPPRGPPLYI